MFFKQVCSMNGEPSWSRVGSFIALLFAVHWISYVVWKTNAIPDLTGVTIFIVSLYTVGKINETVQRRDEAKISSVGTSTTSP